MSEHDRSAVFAKAEARLERILEGFDQLGIDDPELRPEIVATLREIADARAKSEANQDAPN